VFPISYTTLLAFVIGTRYTYNNGTQNATIRAVSQVAYSTVSITEATFHGWSYGYYLVLGLLITELL